MDLDRHPPNMLTSQDMVTAARKAKIVADPLALAAAQPDNDNSDAASAASSAASDEQVCMRVYVMRVHVYCVGMCDMCACVMCGNV